MLPYIFLSGSEALNKNMPNNVLLGDGMWKTAYIKFSTFSFRFKQTLDMDIGFLQG